MIVVNYTPRYREPVNDLVVQFFKDSLNEYDLRMEFDTFASLEEKLTIFVGLDQGEVVGVIAGVVTNQLLSNKLLFQEMMWYVDKNHRGEGTKLMDHMEDWCKDQGIEKIVMCRMHNSMPETLGKFYEKIGYSPFETHYVKDVNNGKNSQANS